MSAESTAASGRPLDAEQLPLALATAFGREVEVLERDASPYASSFPADVAVCGVEVLGELKVLCKYEAGRRFPRFGHRGGPAYEAMVYREVVGPLELSAPAFYGSWTAPGDQGTWLFVEYLDDSRRLSEDAAAGSNLTTAAAWAGHFHRAAEETAPIRGLKVHDGEYYAQWARRTAQLAGENRHERYPWLADLCEAAEHALRALPHRSPTIVHGELTPHNILVRNGEIRPVDWETTAVGAGEIDIASLTEAWPEELIAACEAAYVQARWPQGAPDSHAETRELAGLYWALRWLGDRAEWLEQPTMALRYERLRAIGARLSLI